MLHLFLDMATDEVPHGDRRRLKMQTVDFKFLTPLVWAPQLASPLGEPHARVSATACSASRRGAASSPAHDARNVSVRLRVRLSAAVCGQLGGELSGRRQHDHGRRGSRDAVTVRTSTTTSFQLGCLQGSESG